MYLISYLKPKFTELKGESIKIRDFVKEEIFPLHLLVLLAGIIIKLK